MSSIPIEHHSVIVSVQFNVLSAELQKYSSSTCIFSSEPYTVPGVDPPDNTHSGSGVKPVQSQVVSIQPRSTTVVPVQSRE